MHVLRRLIAIYGLLMLGSATSTLPAMGQAASPAASPHASPAAIVETGGEALGWRVAAERTVTVDGDPAAISPDGQWIAGVGPEREFCVWAAESSESTCDGEGLRIQLATITWAPDSSAVAFSLEAASFFIDSDLYLFDVEEGALTNMTDDGLEELPFSETPSEPVHVDTHPAWSPDGSELIFARTTIPAEEDAAWPTTIMRIEREGGEPEEVYLIRPAEPFIIFSPMYWLPDDTLLFTIGRPDQSDEQNGVWQVGLDGRNSRQVLVGHEESDLPVPWIGDVTPDGDVATVMSIVKALETTGDDESHALVAIPSGEVTPITAEGGVSTGGIAVPIQLSPDGTTGVFVTGFGDLVLVDVATGEQGMVASDVLPFRPTIMTGLQWTETDVIFSVVEEGTAVLLTLEQAG
ncbi:MAG: hypothetical protein M3121_01355 [Chloroflexota bacterium]|nr:hypothetical protein [Chloroflexota bacterium]